MSRHSRRILSLLLALGAGFLMACSDATGPAIDQQGTTANDTCETQGSNTRCN